MTWIVRHYISEHRLARQKLFRQVTEEEVLLMIDRVMVGIFKQGAMMYTMPPGWAEKRRAAMAKQQEEKEKTDEVIDTVTSEQEE